LMVVGAADVAQRTIQDLVDEVPRGSLVVLNDTKVIRARILGEKEGSGGKTEIFLLRREPGDEAIWRAMARASKALRDGMRVRAGPLVVEVRGRDADGLYRVALSSPGGSLDDALRVAAQVPLPPYITRAPTGEDEERYQTVYARVPGAVAAPTAGL